MKSKRWTSSFKFPLVKDGSNLQLSWTHLQSPLIFRYIISLRARLRSIWLTGSSALLSIYSAVSSLQLSPLGQWPHLNSDSETAVLPASLKGDESTRHLILKLCASCAGRVCVHSRHICTAGWLSLCRRTQGPFSPSVALGEKTHVYLSTTGGCWRLTGGTWVISAKVPGSPGNWIQMEISDSHLYSSISYVLDNCHSFLKWRWYPVKRTD